MNLRINAQGFALTTGITDSIHKRLGWAFRRFADEIVAVDVYLKDVNGPRGGADKRASVRVQLRNRTTVFVDSIQDNLYAAIGDVSRRAKRAVKRSIRKETQAARGQEWRFRNGFEPVANR